MVKVETEENVEEDDNNDYAYLVNHYLNKLLYLTQMMITDFAGSLISPISSCIHHSNYSQGQ